MVYHHHLDNLIWVWNQNGPAPAGEFFRYFPGQKYVDVLSYDNYQSLSDRYYRELMDLAGGKPVALGEVPTPPSAEVLKAQPKWAWFMVWAGKVNDRIKPAYSSSYVIKRGDPLLRN
jgi:mannan endo-1,4-beta-mannosidase